LGIASYWSFNERKEMIASENGAHEISRYTWDAASNLHESYLPMGNKTIRLYDAKRNISQQTNPDQTQLQWFRKPDGEVYKHLDLSLGETDFIYNGKKQVIKRTRVGGEVSPYVDLVPKVSYTPSYRILYVPVVHELPTINQDLEYSYAFGHLLTCKDNIRRLLTENQVNLLGQTQGIRLTNIDTGVIIREQNSELDALSREIDIHDGLGRCRSNFDTEGNRTFLEMTITNDEGQLVSESTWWGYNENSQVKVCGDLINKQVTPTVDKGFLLDYKDTIRDAEHVVAYMQNGQPVYTTTKFIYYDDGYLMKSVFSVELPFDTWISREFDEARRLKVYKENLLMQFPLERKVLHNANGQPTEDAQTINNKTTTTTFTYKTDSSGLLDNQVTNFPEGGSEILAYFYRAKETRDIASISGNRNIPGYHPISGVSTIYEGPNGEMNAVLNAMGVLGGMPYPENRFFITDADANVIEKITTDTLGDNLQGTRFFSSIRGQPIANINYTLNPYARKQAQSFEQMFAPPPIATLPSTGGEFRGSANLFSVTKAESMRDPALGAIPMINLISGQSSASELLGNQSQGVTHYTAVANDDYERIAQKVFGDASLGYLIALANGNQTPFAGMRIEVPSLMPSHNDADTALPYQQFISIIQGSLAPYIPANQLILQKQKKHGFFKTLVSLITVGIAVILAIPTGGMSAALLGIINPLGIAAITGVISGLIDASIQGVLIGFGVSQHFSIAESISATFAAFGESWIGTAGKDLSGLKEAELLIDSSFRMASVNIAEQLTLLSMGQIKHLDFLQLATSIIQLGVDPQVDKFLSFNVPLANRLLHTTTANIINSTISGRFNVEQLAAQLVGAGILDTAKSITTKATQSLSNNTARQPENSAKKLPKPLEKHKASNASKKDVYQTERMHREKALHPDAFLKKMGVQDLFDDLNQAIEDFNFVEEPLESYIPSIAEHYKRTPANNGIGEFLYDSVKNSAINMVTSQLPRTLLKQANDTAGNRFFDGIMDNYLEAAEFVAHPVKTSTNIANAAKYLYNHPETIEDAAINTWNRFKKADVAGKVGMVGYGVGSFFGGGVVGKGVFATGKLVAKGLGSQFFNRVDATALNKAQLRDHIKANLDATRKGIDSSNNFKIHAAKNAQISGGYLVDEWTLHRLPKGTTVYGGLPGQSSFYASSDGLHMIDTGKNSYWQNLQVKPHELFGYRPKIGEFVLKQDVLVPTAKVIANPLLGPGGAQQFVINNFNSRLNLIREFDFTEIMRNEMQSSGIRH
jgi:YD repeat-containing protein